MLKTFLYNVWNKNICLQYYVIQFCFVTLPQKHTQQVQPVLQTNPSLILFSFLYFIRKEYHQSLYTKVISKGDEIIREAAKRKWIIRTKQSIGIYVNRVTK